MITAPFHHVMGGWEMPQLVIQLLETRSHDLWQYLMIHGSISWQ